MKPVWARARLWSALAEYFDTDDGSLPEVNFLGVSPSVAAEMFEELKRRSEPIETEIWHDELERSVTIADLPEAPLLAAEGRSGPVHVLMRGIHSKGVRLPDLGVYVRPGEVALDFRMGEEWNADVLAAFVELLAELLRLDAQMNHRTTGPNELHLLFQSSVRDYLRAPDADSDGESPAPRG